MLAAISYAPVLKTKVAEIAAYRNLSMDVKDALFPTFLARPWPHAIHLELTVERIREAVDGRPFALGLDRERYHDDNPRAAQAEFRSLFDSSAGFRAYFDFVGAVEGAVPVLQPSASSSNLLLQLGRAEELDRGLIVHQTRESFIPVLNIAGSVPPLPHDTVFLVDAGWSRNYEFLELWATQAVQRIVDAIPTAEIVVAASSFPSGFSNIVGEGNRSSLERRLFLALRAQFNQANLTYGDWGSTRLEQSGGGGDIPPRVDLALPAGWAIFRADTDQGQTFGDMANAARNSAAFQLVPDCFGKEMVLATPGPEGITGTSKNTRARINMHLTIHSGVSGTLDTDDVEYVD